MGRSEIVGIDGKVLSAADISAIMGQRDNLAVEIVVESMLSHGELASIDEVGNPLDGYSYIINDVYGRKVTFDDVFCRISEPDGRIDVIPLERLKAIWFDLVNAG